MKSTMLSLILSIFMLFTQAQDMTVASFNIRMKTNSDVGNLWDDRKVALTNLIKFHEFDIFGIQEGFYVQVQDVKQHLPGFNYVGVGRDDGRQEGEHSAIFYNEKRFTVLKSGTFWLSATDTEQPNKGWDAVLPRICTWGVFKDKKSGKQFIFMNTHFDHVGVVARRESAKLILAKAKEFAKDLPLILTGDFNVDENNEAYFTLAKSGVVQDVHDLAKIVYTPNASFNGWGKNLEAQGRIDHIFITKPFTVRKYGILTDTYLGKFPSDHFPVMAELTW
ncbi:endonuclease/exonuclease/phosphatase family protein [Sphingobacterium paludis]|uniref:Endonuclease/exonuclease/phosphatase family metal-dependent hydrolase n=1 Tax=Sphingobacterium paludis TaxID=1476465 RepID=A0A4R7CVX4_9SPHI|nr:endonuclease/exonuclease/phosphatase family protein [Sphingobacterium paludis]TDS10396.1 endonuclease/exonuclease/phosphatase family metal-dependent hydrolase [Sphingobacterium paludis]